MKNSNARVMAAAIFVFILNVCLSAAQKPAVQLKAPEPPAKTSATPAEPQAAGSSDKVVIKVGGRSVTQKEIDFLVASLNPQARERLEAEGRGPLGEDYVKILLLSSQAEAEHLGDNPELRERLEFERNQLMAQAEYDKITKEIQVTPEEVGKYYQDHKRDFETAQVREFVVRKRPEGAKDGTPGFPEVDAKAKADAMRKALMSGEDANKVKQDFAVPNQVLVDPEPRIVRRKRLLPELEKAAFESKDGEVSEPLETSQAIVFLQIVGHGALEQKDVSQEIEETVKQDKLKEAIDGLRKKSDVWLDGDYFKAPPTPPPPAAPAPPAPPKL